MNNAKPDKPVGDSSSASSSPRQSASTNAATQPKKHSLHAGLANEPRPGLGAPTSPAGELTPVDEPLEKLSDAAPALPPKERHEPSEQDSQSLAQEEERSTGVSGHASGA